MLSHNKPRAHQLANNLGSYRVAFDLADHPGPHRGAHQLADNLGSHRVALDLPYHPGPHGGAH